MRVNNHKLHHTKIHGKCNENLLFGRVLEVEISSATVRLADTSIGPKCLDGGHHFQKHVRLGLGVCDLARDGWVSKANGGD